MQSFTYSENIPRFNECSFLLTPKTFPDLMNEVFYLLRKHYNLRSFNLFVTDNRRNKYLLNSSVYRANQIWQTQPSEIKDWV